MQNLVDAVTTLNSLSKLIEEGENMIVLDEIRTKVNSIVLLHHTTGTKMTEHWHETHRS